MALDEALLNSVERGTSQPLLRLYRWKPATVTLGYFQHGSDVVNPEACQRLGYDVVRRVTGGRAVLHDDEVTYAVIAPDADVVFPGGIAANYHVIAEVLHQTLAACGQKTEIASGRKVNESTEGVQKSACFTAPALSELVHAGCKMTGSAQKRLNKAFLQHGSIPVNIDLKRLYQALHTGPAGDEGRAVEKLASRVGWLNRFLPQGTTVDAVEQVLIEQFARKLGIRFRPDVPTADEAAAAQILMAEKYGNRDWTLKGIISSPEQTHQG
jgi:lipoate-protein ligase A